MTWTHYDDWKTTDPDLEAGWCVDHGDDPCDCEDPEPDYAQMWEDRMARHDDRWQ
jgi:hypothetical protein